MDRRITDRTEGEEHARQTIISDNTNIKGDFTANDDVILHGDFDGTMNLDALLVVKKNGKMKGKINTRDMIIEGEVEGAIVVQNKIEVRADGRFRGNVTCKQIAIEENAFFKGDVNMDDGQQVTPTYFKEKRQDVLDENE